MPQALPLAATVIAAGVASAAELGTLATSLLIAGVSSLAGLAAQRSLADPFESQTESGHLMNIKSTDAPKPVIYGQMKVGGIIEYMSSTGDNNEYLHIILSLCEGEIEGLINVWLDDKLISEYGSDAYYEFYNGSSTQGVCQTLQDADPNWNDPMKNTAYIYVRLRFNPDKFAAQPVITVEVKGLKVYDPRNNLTAYTRNPALCYYDFVINQRYGGGMDSVFWNSISIQDVANWCDTQGYNMDVVINQKAKLSDISDKLLLSFRSAVIWTGEEFMLKFVDYDAPVMSLNEDDIINSSFKGRQPSIQNLPNSLTLTFVNKDNGYTSESRNLPNLSAVTSDGTVESKEITFLGSADFEQVEKIGIYHLERMRMDSGYTFSAGSKALPLEPIDIIKVTHSLPGWTDKIVRVQNIEITENNEVLLSVLDEDIALYDDSINTTTHSTYSTNLPSPTDVPGEVTNVAFIEEEYYNKDVSYTRLKGTFTKPDNPFLDYVEVWVNAYGTGWVHYTDTRDSFTIEPVREQANYLVKFISVSITGTRMNFNNATEWSCNVIGKNTPPDNVENFYIIPQSDTIILMWDSVSNVDLLGYEIRKGTNWNGGIFVGFTKALTFKLNGVAPGTHSYMIKSVDTRGEYSSNYQIASCTVYGPASYSITNNPSPVSDFDEAGEVHNNTEQYNDPTYGNVLRVKRILENNGDFETGDTTGWGLYVASGASASLGVNTTDPFEGTYCGKVTITGAGSIDSDIQLYQDNLTIVKGSKYTINFVSRAADWRNIKVDIVKSSDFATSYTEEGKQTFEIVTQGPGVPVAWDTGFGDAGMQVVQDWNVLSVTFIASQDATDARLSFFLGGDVNDVEFDNVEFSNLSGVYTSPQYDRGSVVTRRCWPDFDVLFFGTGTTWADQFLATDLWTDKFNPGDTWLDLFGQYIAGIIKMKLLYSDDGNNWNEISYFESFVTEVQCRYTKYQIEIHDVSSEGWIAVQPVTYKEAYWS